MIEILITLEETAPGELRVTQSANGEATPMEVEHADRLRAAVQEHMETVMLEEGNGAGINVSGEGHGREIKPNGC